MNTNPMELMGVSENPFSNEFVKSEIKFMELDTQNNLKYKGIEIRHKPLFHQLNDYLNKRYHIGDLTVPVFGIDGHLWMSMTPMEIQSNFLAWATATGDVGMGGLGMGYTALRCAAQEDVYEVTVFEKDKRVIDFFVKQYEHRPEFKKIIINHGDAREMFNGFSFDFVYMDIYDALLSNNMLTDYKLFNSANSIGEYHFWSEEKIVLAGINDHLISSDALTYQQRLYFQAWQQTEESNMYDPVYDTDYIKLALETMGLYYDE